MTKLTSLLLLLLCFMSKAQTLSGTIKNQSGVPIVNALVCLANNPAVFVKTNTTGQFNITGTATTALRIGAFGYKTIPSTLTRQIVLQKDTYLNTDVYHVSFDHLRAGPGYTDTELKKDFGCAYGKGVYDGTAASDRTTVDYNVSRDPGGVSLKVKFPKGALKTESSGIDTRIPLSNTYQNNTFQSKDLYLSYWVKFSDNFDFSKCGGKLPSLGGSTPGTRDENRWKGRIMWRNGGSIQFYMELPDNSFNAEDDERLWGEKVKEGSGICDFAYTPYLNTPGWHNIELHYKFETPGQNDGYFEGWVDGQDHSYMNSTVFNKYIEPGTSRANITINYLLLSAFLGGSSDSYKPTEDQYAWFDEIRVSSTRINEYNTYNTASNTVAVNSSPAVGTTTEAPQPVVANTTTDLITVSPNPSNGIFNLSKSASWEVANLSGRIVRAGTGTVINLSSQIKGIYLLQIVDLPVVKLVLE